MKRSTAGGDRDNVHSSRFYIINCTTLVGSWGPEINRELRRQAGAGAGVVRGGVGEGVEVGCPAIRSNNLCFNHHNNPAVYGPPVVINWVQTLSALVNV